MLIGSRLRIRKRDSQICIFVIERLRTETVDGSRIFLADSENGRSLRDVSSFIAQGAAMSFYRREEPIRGFAGKPSAEATA